MRKRGSLPAEEFGQGALELAVQVEGTIEKPAAGAARSIAMKGSGGGFENLGVMSQAEVVVRPQHDALLTFYDDRGILGIGNRLEIGIEPGSLNFSGLGELTALFKQSDSLQSLNIHGASIQSLAGEGLY